MLKLDLDFTLARENQGEGPLGPDFKPRIAQKSEEGEDEEEEWDEEEEEEESEEMETGEEAISEEPTKPVNLNTLHFNCFHCSFTAKSMIEFAQHVRTHELFQNSLVKSPGSSKAPASPIHTDDDEMEEFVTVTPVYGENTDCADKDSMSEVKEEMSEKVRKPLYQCKLCPFTTDSLDAFEMHNRIHLPYRCGYCNYSQYQPGKIKQHHNYKHAPEGLELKIIEQNPKPNKPRAKSPAKQRPLTYSKPGPKSTKKYHQEMYQDEENQTVPNTASAAEEEIKEDVGEGEEQGTEDTICFEEPAYQPEIKLPDVRQLPDELLAVLLMKYGATRTPWMEVMSESDLNTSGESASGNMLVMGNPGTEEMEELHMSEVSDNGRGMAFTSDLKEGTGDDREGDEEVDMYNEEDSTENLLDVGDEEIRVEDEGAMNEDAD